MKPQIELATTETPDGGKMGLYQHDHDFAIKINGQQLMSSRQYESELALARLGCAHLVGHEAPRVLIGGLGMGYTLRQTLDMLGEGAKVTVSELLPDVVAWNREYFKELNGQPLEDKRTEIKLGDILPLLSDSAGSFDAILLDIDNGPSAITDTGNNQLYTREGIEICKRALRKQGSLAVWSAEPSKEFETLLMSCNFQVRRYKVPAYTGTTKNSRFIWVAAEDVKLLPPGGGEPRPAKKKKPKGSKYSYRKR
jgi:spermidine synthase